jgi:UDP-glucose:tetrahydrobiopterin glucosyltransferase
MPPLKLLFMSTPVGPLGSGLGGGVELTLLNMAQALQARGHQIQVVAPRESRLPVSIPIQQIEGGLQTPAQTQSHFSPITLPANSVLGNMWEFARQNQSRYDLIVNFAYDWLPFYLTPFFETGIAHWVSMGSLSDALDQVASTVVSRYPQTIGVYTQTQADTFPFGDACYLLGSGLDLSLYDYCCQPENSLGWLGRIAPEKGLEDAVAAVAQLGIPLKIMGQIQDPDYWQQIQHRFPDAPIQYLGFLDTAEMQRILRQCRGLLVTSRWVEAFGNVLIEALACGVPVIAYARGGPREIVRDGQTGWLVEPDSIPGLVRAIQNLDQIDRATCRRQAEQEYSLAALGDRTEQWLYSCFRQDQKPSSTA